MRGRVSAYTAAVMLVAATVFMVFQHLGIALAGDGDPIVAGAFNSEQNHARLSMDCHPGNPCTNIRFGAFQAEHVADGNDIDPVGVLGYAGSSGVSSGSGFSIGVLGESAGDGVMGTGGRNGVFGRSRNGGASGVYGQNDGSGYGVAGRSTAGVGVFGIGGSNGVFGQSGNSAASGVYAQNDSAGYGVAGRAANGTGVFGDSANRVGVLGTSVGGIGVRAYSQTGMALLVLGRAHFSMSGALTISYPNRVGTLSGSPVTADAFVVATVQQNVGVWVVAAIPNATTHTIKIVLNAPPGTSAAPKSVKVAFFVFEGD